MNKNHFKAFLKRFLVKLTEYIYNFLKYEKTALIKLLLIKYFYSRCKLNKL